MISEQSTVKEAKDWLREEAKNGGAICPCCRQRAQVYRRTITSAMARALILMYQASKPGEYIHWPTLLKPLGAHGDESKLVYWRLVEKQAGLREDGSPRNGYWRLTEMGRLFVEQHKTVPSHALVYDGRCLGYDGEPISIVGALGTRFSYAELMGLVSA